MRSIRFQQDNIEGMMWPPPAPTSWPLILSDVATNLRAALDFVAWQLALRRIREDGLSGEPRRITGFSICDSPGNSSGGFANHVDNGPLTDVLQAAIPIIASFQPYPTPQRPENHLLAILRELSNLTKHRVLIQPNQVMRLTAPPGGRTAITFGARGMRVISSGPTDSSEPPVSILVRIDVPSLNPSEYDISVLDDIHLFVRDEILPQFSTFFE